MAGTPGWQVERVKSYYVETTSKSYLQGWAKGSLGFHFGLADSSTASHEESLIATNEYLARQAGVERGTRVLDAGCGVGGSSIYLAEVFAANVVGITLVPEQVDLAREYATERGVHSLVSFECMDMVDTSFPPSSFDVVWNIESVCHVLDVDAYLAHVHELLVDGGRFACIDLCVSSEGESDLGHAISEGWALAPMRTPQQILNALGHAGFTHAEHVDLTPRALLSALALRAAASKRLLALRAESAFLGQDSPAYEKHCRAALAMVDGIESGQTTVSHFVAVRPPR